MAIEQQQNISHALNIQSTAEGGGLKTIAALTMTASCPRRVFIAASQRAARRLVHAVLRSCVRMKQV